MVTIFEGGDTGNLAQPLAFLYLISNVVSFENPKSRPMCDLDRENPDFDSCCDIFVKFS